MKRRTQLTILIYTLLSNCLFGQQSPLFSQFPDHFELNNPAAVSPDELFYGKGRLLKGHSISTISRTQWLFGGFDKPPMTIGVVYNWFDKHFGTNEPLNHVLGIDAFFDQAGTLTFWNLGFRYNRNLSNKLFIGGKVEFNGMTLGNDGQLYGDLANDNLYQDLRNRRRPLRLNAGTGIFYFNDLRNRNFDRLYYFFGISGKYKSSIQLKSLNQTEFVRWQASLLGGLRYRHLSLSIRIRNGFEVSPFVDVFGKFYLLHNIYLGSYFSSDFETNTRIVGAYFGSEINYSKKIRRLLFSIGFGQTLRSVTNYPIIDFNIKFSIN